MPYEYKERESDLIDWVPDVYKDDPEPLTLCYAKADFDQWEAMISERHRAINTRVSALRAYVTKLKAAEASGLASAEASDMESLEEEADTLSLETGAALPKLPHVPSENALVLMHFVKGWKNVVADGVPVPFSLPRLMGLDPEVLYGAAIDIKLAQSDAIMARLAVRKSDVEIEQAGND